MDKNTPIQRRSSLNTSQVAHPIAESTCLNATTSAPANSSWFGQLSPRISPGQRSNSSVFLSNVRESPTRAMSTTDSNKKSSNLSYTPQSGHKLNLSRIDPRIYADVNSSGLVSRVVKYQESHSKRLQSSMSVNNLYNKPGQFPVVHLTKKELPFKASKNNVSMTRIAPPERTVFYGDTLSSLLRSNSILGIGTHKTDEQLSCENKPIIHPPPTESDLEPTRSVLDVLKEISRKRINTNDVQQLEQSKKSCSRGEFYDLVDTAQPNTLATYVNINNAHSYKRQREIAQLPQTDAVYGTPNGTLHHTQTSPEHLAKRRQSNYNNDITSSLSSSVRYMKKRKHYEQTPRMGASRYITTSGGSSSSSSPEEEEQQVAKIQRKQGDLQYNQLTKSSSYSNAPITPLPITPYPKNSNVQQINVNHSPSEISLVQSNVEIPAIPPQRTASAPVSSYASHSVSPVAADKSKPKLTLFNIIYDESKEQERTIDVPSPDILELSGCAGINFVKPKKREDIIMSKNSIIESTERAKLGLMLCALRGEIYPGMTLDDIDCDIDSDIINSSAKSKSDSPRTSFVHKPTAETTFGLSSITKTVTTTSITTTTAAPSPDKPHIVSVETLQTNQTSNDGEIPTQISPNTSAPIATASSLNNVTSITATTALTVTTAAPTALVNKLTFAAPASTSSATSATATFSFGIPKTVDSSAGSITSNNTASEKATTKTTASEMPNFSLTQSKPMFSFGNPTTVLPTLPTTVATEKKNEPIIGIGGTTTPNFKFNSNGSNTSTTTTNTTAAAAAAATPVATSMTLPTFSANTITPAFKFGTALSATTVGSSSITTSTFATNTSVIGTPQTNGSSSKASPLTAFGNTFKPISDAATPVAVTTAAEAPAPFSFGVAANTATNAATVPAVTSAFQLPVTQGTKAFSFSTPTSQASASDKSTTQPSLNASMFSFSGGNNPAQPIAGATTTRAGGFSFANSNHISATATTNATNTTGAFSFASAASAPPSGGTGSNQAMTTTTTASNVFSFGQKPATVSSFSFASSSNQSNGAENTVNSSAAVAMPFAFNGGNSTNNIVSTPIPKAAAAAAASTNLFSFGGNGSSSEPAATANTTVNATNSIFGGGGASAGINGATPSTFTFNAGQSATPAFGSNGATAPATTTNTNGGATSIPFTFTGGASQTANKTTTGAGGGGGGFSFDTVAAQNANATGNTNIFGNATNATAATTITAAPNTGIVPPSFNFGGGSNNLANSTTTGNSSFGGNTATAAAASKMFSFNNTNNVAPGMSNPVAASTPISNNIFGNAVGGTKTTASGAGGFSFSKTAKSFTNTNATAPAFAFGSSTTNPQGAQVKPFSFSGATAASPTASVPVAPMNAGGSIFAAKPAGAAAPFRFSGATNNNANVNAPTTMQNNVFTPPTVGPSDRIYRRATRRLQK